MVLIFKKKIPIIKKYNEVDDLKRIINNKDEEIENLKTILKSEQQQNKKLKEHISEFVNKCRENGVF